MTQYEKLIKSIRKGIGGSLPRHLTERIVPKIADALIADGWIRPPCKVGDMVYVKYYGEIVNAYVTEFEINSRGIVAKVYIDPDTDREYDAEDLFLTEEKAEQVLEGGAD